MSVDGAHVIKQKQLLSVTASAVAGEASVWQSSVTRVVGCRAFLFAAILQGGFASEVGQQSLVSVLSSCTPALRQLVVLLEQCGKVQGASAGKVKAPKEPQVG